MNKLTRGLMTCLLTFGMALAVPVALTVSDDVYAAPGGGGNADNDQDGYTTGGNPAFRDCDDNDPDVNPGATEGPFGDATCSDTKDNDCDELTDANDPDCQDGVACNDNDGDGYGSPGHPDCPNGAATDCDDANPDVNPGATEAPPGSDVCQDQLDNDCDGATDGQDPGCQVAVNLEACNIVGDEDNDGLADCDDPDCVEAVNCQPGGQKAFVIPMNYELGMHCTGFEFAYCCVLPPYNSILAQVIRTDKNPIEFQGGKSVGWPNTLEADHSVGLDFLGRPTVVRDTVMDDNGNFNKYMLTYWHDAQTRGDDPNGKPQNSRLISQVEGNSLLMWNTVFDSADVGAGNALVYGNYNGSRKVLQGDGTFGQAEDNYANAWLNHFYIYGDLEGHDANGDPVGPGTNNPTSAELDKIRLGLPNAHIPFSTVLPDNSGPAFHPMGPTAEAKPVLTFSTDHGTVVFTQMKVLENLPVMLTSPRIWEALGLPLTPFEDTIDFFGDPGLVDEDSIRPYVAMKAQLHHADCVGTTCTPGDAVLDDGKPVIGFGTAPIDIPNCERCHSEFSGSNAAQNDTRNPDVKENVQLEMDFWNDYYMIDTGAGDSDWYSRLKGAAISILNIHDNEHGTYFLTGGDGPGGNPDYPATGFGIPQNFRLGHESVLCQRCHADNVIAVVKSADCGPNSITCNDGDLIPPLTEAIHFNHREQTERYCSAGLGGHNKCNVNSDCDTPIGNDGICEEGNIVFTDAEGRSGGCQGCHPAHRSDGSLASYPISEDGSNTFAGSDNRDAAGGCFVGRDVHSNAVKDAVVTNQANPMFGEGGGAETPAHLNPVGQWLSQNVFTDPSEVPDGDSGAGIWCTNCHQQLSQEMWKAENCENLIGGPDDPPAGDRPDCTNNVRNPIGGDLAAVAAAVGVDPLQAESWLDPKTTGSADGEDNTHAIWAPDPGLCDYVVEYVTPEIPIHPAQDATVAVVEVVIGAPGDGTCTEAGAVGVDIDCGPVNGGPRFQLCGTLDNDPVPDFSVSLPGAVNADGPFCTTPDCVANAQVALGPCTLAAGDNCAVPVPFSAATDGRDHWLSPGEPHCADCHAAPYTEQSGNIDAFPPFNYPRKASLNRYSRGHQDITCQGCHESIHGLYPVTPPGMYGDKAIDTTSYAQAASMNADGSHGPLKCGACHQTNEAGVYVNPDNRIDTSLAFRGTVIDDNFDAAVSWMHTFTENVDPADFICQRCHGDNRALIDQENGRWTDHAYDARVTRDAMDKAEIANQGYISGDPDANQNPEQTVCKSCHGDRSKTLKKRGCTTKWKNHLVQGRVADKVWEYVTGNNIESEPAADGTHCGW